MRILTLLAASAISIVASSGTGYAATVAINQERQESVSVDEFVTIDDLFEEAKREPKRAIGHISKLLDGADKPLQATLRPVRGFAYLKVGKFREATQDFDEAHRSDPTSSWPSYMQFIGGLIIENNDIASAGLDQMIEVAPDEVRALNTSLVYPYLRGNKTPHKDDQVIALARLGFGGINRDGMYEWAIRTLIERGDFAGAKDMVKLLRDVTIANTMLTSRSFEPIWSDLEASVGDHMAAIGEKSIAAGRAAIAEDPSDMRNRTYLVEALATLGRYDEADREGSQVGKTSEELAGFDEDGGWVIDAHARALFAAKRRDEADRRYAALIAARGETVWIISMLINRIELLVQSNKFAEAAKALPQVEEAVKTKGSPYAQQLVRRLRLCTNTGLGQSTDQAALKADFVAHAKDIKSASVEGYLCLGDQASAKRLVIEMLADKDQRERVISNLQPDEDLSSDPSMWGEYWDQLRADPEIMAAYRKVGRDLPERFRIP